MATIQRLATASKAFEYYESSCNAISGEHSYEAPAGTLSFWLVLDGGQSTAVSRQRQAISGHAGFVGIVGPRTEMMFKVRGRWRALGLHVQEAMIRKVLGQRSAPFLYDPDCLLYTSDEQLSACMGAIHQDSQMHSSAGMLYIDHMVGAIVELFLNRYCGLNPKVQTQQTPSSMFKKRTAEFILRNLGEKIQLQDMADNVEMSRSKFCDLFKEEFGDSPHHYVLKKRIDHATRALKRGSTDIVGLSLQLGFSDQSQFTKIFKKFVGVPPRTYIRNIG